ncbi:MAG: hypothetical protein PVH35_10050 [Syntrophobacterales bacterium]
MGQFPGGSRFDEPLMIGETGETGGRARRGLKCGSRNGERGVFFGADGQQAKPAAELTGS